jgi:hypothetical protein
MSFMWEVGHSIINLMVYIVRRRHSDSDYLCTLKYKKEKVWLFECFLGAATAYSMVDFKIGDCIFDYNIVDMFI